MDCTTATPTPTPAIAASTTQLKLLGTWASSYTHRVQLALKLKGLEFEYVEEDLANKSPSLLLHNPVYKKVPVFLHAGRPIAESVVILQYIDESWPDNPIMSSDPYERAVVRFWCHFSDNKLSPAVAAVFQSAGEVQKAAVEQVREDLAVIEGELRDGFFKGRRFFGGEKIGLLDIVFGCGSYWLVVFEAVLEVKLFDPEAFPLFSAWLRSFEELEEVKEIIPATDRLLEYARGLRHMLLSLAAMNSNGTPPGSTSTSTSTTTDVEVGKDNGGVVKATTTTTDVEVGKDNGGVVKATTTPTDVEVGKDNGGVVKAGEVDVK